MNIQVLELLNNPLAVSEKDLFLLEDELEQYPYFQPLHLLRAKAVYKSEDQKFASVLHKTATYCANRGILYEYLNAELSQPEPEIPAKTESVSDTSISKDSQKIKDVSSDIDEQSLDKAIDLDEGLVQKKDNTEKSNVTDSNISDVHDILQANQTLDDVQNDNLSKETEVDKTLNEVQSTEEIHANDRHSFGEWLSLTSHSKQEKEEVVNEKFKIIEDFLEKNPKITPAKVYKPSIEINPNPKENLSHLMTETLAKIYVEQNKYDKAIKAYTILRLKYPEKSGYFADQIKEIKDLKNN